MLLSFSFLHKLTKNNYSQTYLTYIILNEINKNTEAYSRTPL